MDLMGKNGSSWGVQRWPPKKNGKGFFFFRINDGWVMFTHLFSMRFVRELYTLQKKKWNERQEPENDGFRNFGDFSVNYEDCLVSMFVLEGVHTYNVQFPLPKGVRNLGVAKNHICSPAKPSSWSEVPSKGILSRHNELGWQKVYIATEKRVFWHDVWWCYNATQSIGMYNINILLLYLLWFNGLKFVNQALFQFLVTRGFSAL